MRLIINRCYLNKGEEIDQPIRDYLRKEARRLKCPVTVLDYMGNHVEMIQPRSKSCRVPNSLSRQLVNGAVTDMQDSKAEMEFWTEAICTDSFGGTVEESHYMSSAANPRISQKRG